MWQPPYRFLGDVRGCSADRGVNIQQLRHLGETKAGFSSLQRRKEAQQGRVGHSCCPPPLFPLLLVRQEQLNCLRELTPRVQILPSLSQSLRWRCGISCSTARPFTNPSWGAKLLCREWCFPVGFQPAGRWLVWEERDTHSLPVRVSHLILAHRLVLLQSHADGDGDAASRTTTHGGSAPVQEPPACRGEPRHLRGGYCQVLQALPDGVKDGFSLWLGRLTAQWSVEDEEEAARERRRREREKQLRSQAEEGLNGTGSGSESTGPAQENQ